jgi:hypothetical protein
MEFLKPQAFIHEDMFAGSPTVALSLKVETCNAPAHIRLDTFAGTHELLDSMHTGM